MNKAQGHMNMYNDYFAPDALFAGQFSLMLSDAQFFLIASTMVSGAMMTTST